MELSQEEQQAGTSKSGRFRASHPFFPPLQEPTPSSSTPQEPLGPPQNKTQEDERAATLLTPPGGAQQALLVGATGF